MNRNFGRQELNVLGEPLEECSADPLTGFYRTGCCSAGRDGAAVHLVCIQASAEFLQFSKSRGNDLSTPLPEAAFPGLKPGDRWCLVVGRWAEAHAAGAAPRVWLRATHTNALRFVDLATLKQFALDLS